ncbi:hypothetical protein [Singulisphaera sp. PoT]|uniref:hypothetical protein n=1 Tax=Singulisphaera sp. PoT TaxID=3411797 RepID=UPI003BF4C759
MRLRVPSSQKGQDGTPLDVEALPPLVVDDLPEVLEPTTPEAPAAEVPTPVVLNGRIDPKDDVDSFRLAVTPGRLYRVSLESHGLGSALRASLRVKSSRGQVWASGPTNTVEATAGVPEHETPDPSAVFVVPEGPAEVDLEIRGDWLDAGPEPAAAEHGHAYRAKVVPVTPGFSVDLLTAQVGVPRGGTAAVGVVLRRDGFRGPVTLGLANPPSGLTFIPGSIPEGKSIGSFTVGASPDAGFEPVYLDVVGRGFLPGSKVPIVAHARKALPFGEPTTMPYREPPDEADGKAVSPGIPAYLRTRVLSQAGLLAAPVRATEIVGEALPRPIRLARGRSTFFRVTIRRSPRAEGRLTVDPLPLPVGLDVSQGLIGERDNEAFISVDAEPDFPLGTTTVALLAKGTIGGVERSFALPALTLEIVGDADAIGFPDGVDAFMPER